jgi:signal peptidase I
MRLYSAVRVPIGRGIVIASAVIFATIILGVSAGYRVNVTPSLPLGLYRLTPVHGPLRPGELVTFRLPVPLRLHRFLGSFTKPVAGLPGDRVCVEGGQLRINGVHYGPILATAPVHALQDGECITVGEGHVFIASASPRSYDSRYFGAIPIAEVQPSRLVFTWTEHTQ